jgi:CBS domain-containing protein
MLTKATTKSILECVENGNMGFAVICGKEHNLYGLVSSADIRKALLKNINQPSNISPEDLINKTPISINASATVIELLQLIKSCPFPIMYLPVVDDANNAVGIINFVHLIKGEI